MPIDDKFPPWWDFFIVEICWKAMMIIIIVVNIVIAIIDVIIVIILVITLHCHNYPTAITKSKAGAGYTLPWLILNPIGILLGLLPLIGKSLYFL